MRRCSCASTLEQLVVARIRVRFEDERVIQFRDSSSWGCGRSWRFESSRDASPSRRRELDAHESRTATILAAGAWQEASFASASLAQEGFCYRILSKPV